MKPKQGSSTTYTKRMLDRIIRVALIDIQFPFLLAFLDKQEIAETMGGLIITEIIGVFLVYCAKSYFETKESERTRIKEMKMNEETESWDSEREEDI